MIILPFRELILTTIIIFLPFFIADAYEGSVKYGIYGLIIPFVIFPYIAYFHGIYQYGGDDIALY